MSKRFYITTAIYYVNGQPHLGHAYEMVITDVIARARRSLGEPTVFLTGLDEHGQKVQQAAQAEGKSPGQYCDELSAIFRQFAARLNLSIDDFIRTSTPRHQSALAGELGDRIADGLDDVIRSVALATLGDLRRSKPTIRGHETAHASSGSGCVGMALRALERGACTCAQ